MSEPIGPSQGWLSRLNQSWSTQAMGKLLPLAVFVCAGALFIGHTHWAHSLTAPPAVGGDSPIYDSLGWELSHGRGYSQNFADPEFRQPYEQAGTAKHLSTQSGVNVDRPPLYPWLLAAGNRLFGRQFWFARIVQGVLMASVAAWASRLAFQCGGICPAILSALLFTIIDWRTRWSTREILTESLACWLVMLLAHCLIQYWRSGRIRWAAGAGVVWGLCYLCRTMMILWLPVLVIAFVFGREKHSLRSKVLASLVFFLTGFIVCLPWWIRTCSILGEFRPLGTQGAEQLSAAYSDRAFHRMGMWINLDDDDFFDSLPVHDDSVANALTRARFSSEQAWAWIQSHPLKAALLWPMRVIQEFRPHGSGDLFVLAFALLGLRLLSHRAEGRVGWTILLSQILAVAATWSVSGRFVIPLLGILHVAAGIGLWGACVLLCERTRDARATLSIK